MSFIIDSLMQTFWHVWTQNDHLLPIGARPFLAQSKANPKGVQE